jgi:hypothetical protein
MQLKRTISRILVNLPGWRTNRKIVVIESDDWGSIRMPSKKVYEKLLKFGIKVDQCHFNRFDSLEGDEDLTQLFDVLLSFKDKNGKHPVITANLLVANPLFEKIKESDFTEYFYEPVTETFKRYPVHSNSFSLWREGLANMIFIPQFHGREHLNINRWLKVLQMGSKETIYSFENQLFGISTTITSEKRKSYLAAFDIDCPDDILFQKSVINDGIQLFKYLMNYQPYTFIAPNYVWSPLLEEDLFNNGVIAIQGGNSHQIPIDGQIYKTRKHYLNEKNDYGLFYLIRNVLFEPSSNPNIDWIDACLRDIAIAFRLKKPAIISSHRVNFIGTIEKTNREKNLKLLRHLIYNIIKRWPDVEFMSSDQLAKLMLDSK